MATDIYDDDDLRITRFVGPGKKMQYQLTWMRGLDYCIYPSKDEIIQVLKDMIEAVEKS